MYVHICISVSISKYSATFDNSLHIAATKATNTIKLNHVHMPTAARRPHLHIYLAICQRWPHRPPTAPVVSWCHFWLRGVSGHLWRVLSHPAPPQTHTARCYLGTTLAQTDHCIEEGTRRSGRAASRERVRKPGVVCLVVFVRIVRSINFAFFQVKSSATGEKRLY